MISLKRLQEQMNLAFLKKDYSDISSLVDGGGGLSPDEALQVYADGYVARLTEQLGDTFEACWWALGDEDFFKACQLFISENPSTSYNLGDYGKNFEQFLKNHKSELAFLPELARFEWLFKEVFHQAPHHGLEDFSNVQESTKFYFAPTAQLFSSPFLVHEIWGLKDQQDPPDLDWERPCHILMYKWQNQVYTLPLEPEAHSLFKALFSGQSLGEALESVSAQFESLTPELVSETFQLLAETKIVTEAQ